VLENTPTRRLVTVPILFVATALLWILSPVLLVAGAVVDLVRWSIHRRPFMACRLVVFLLAYTSAEVVGLAALGISWVRCRVARTDACAQRDAFVIQKAWAEFLFVVVTGLLRLTIRVTGIESVEAAPFILLSRHTSIVDTLLPTHFVSRPHDRHIRFVLKTELLVDPALDVAGNRLPNYFVRRDASHAAESEDAIERLAREMPEGEAVLIFPEGTRYTPEKHRRALRRLAERSPGLHARAEHLRHVLPPRPRGTLALLRGSDADVVVLAHRGLEGLVSIADIWRGAMVGRQVDVAFERIERAQVPDTEHGRVDWLFDVWARIDAWVAGESGS
jgi:1-acyl-sn-glycerol-3-phosphate acyltransferase